MPGSEDAGECPEGLSPELGKPVRVNLHDLGLSTFYGFGAALTEAAAYTYSLMSPENKKSYLEAVFGKNGLDYRICRICIGSSDFSLADHVYIDEGDETLSSFDLGIDKDYVIPMARDVLAYRKGDVDFFASPWSPPAFMKDSGSRIGGHLMKKYYKLYAEYTARFVLEYAKEGIKIAAVTPQNEPGNGNGWETCLYTAEEEAAYIHVLKGTLKEHGLDTMIFGWDHNRHGLFERAEYLYSHVYDDVDGIAFHWYSGGGCFEDIPLVRGTWPGKYIIESEFTNSEKNYFGRYADEIRRLLHVGVNAIVEWNALLDERGMPCHNRDWGCISPVHYDRQKKLLYHSVNYDEIKLFSRLLKKGDILLATSVAGTGIECAAGRKPGGTVAVFLHNSLNSGKNVTLKCRGKQLKVILPANSDVALEIEE